MIDFVRAGIEQDDRTELPFSPERMLESVHGAVDDALKAGYNGVHFLGEMEWATRSVPGAERLEFMDLSGARCLIDAAVRLGPQRRIVVHQPRRAVRRLFEILSQRGQAVELVA